MGEVGRLRDVQEVAALLPRANQRPVRPVRDPESQVQSERQQNQRGEHKEQHAWNDLFHEIPLLCFKACAAGIKKNIGITKREYYGECV